MPVTRTRETVRPKRRPRSRVRTIALAAILLTLALGVGLGATPGAFRYWSATHLPRATLDFELVHARRELRIPDAMLRPVETAERGVVSRWSWSDDGASASAAYAGLYTQLRIIEETSIPTLRQQLSDDLETLTIVLNARHIDGMPGVDAYQDRLDATLQRIRTAVLPGDFADVDVYVRGQTDALRAMPATFRRLRDLDTMLQGMELVGVETSVARTQYAQDLRTFAAAASVADYAHLRATIDAQATQVLADEAAIAPTAAPALLNAFQTRIDSLRAAGEDVVPFQQAHDQDARLIAAGQTPGYLAFVQSLSQQAQAMLLPAARAQAHHDLVALGRLVVAGQAKYLLSPYDGRRYPAAYEYATTVPDYGGYGSVQRELAGAVTIDDFRQADADITAQSTLLRAYLANFDDHTQSGQAHATDLTLIKDFGLAGGKVIVISLREQAARFYNTGKLVQWSLVTTGRPERPSPPGLHYATEKLSPTTFTSSEPRSSPFWYAPTPVNYAIAYEDGGFFLHDGWWRNRFGPGTNLPHYEPEAFNGGSHGCINFPAAIMPWVYGWTAVGTPILVY